jgi:hypothetical protein
MGKLSKPDKKIVYDGKLCQLLDLYNKMLLVLAENVESNQLQNIHKGLRGESVVLMGKNTMMKCVGTCTGQVRPASTSPSECQDIGLASMVQTSKGAHLKNKSPPVAHQGTGVGPGLDIVRKWRRHLAIIHIA